MTDSVAVVTGGAGVLGLAVARILSRDHHVVLSDANKDGLVTALDVLCQLDVSAESVAADITDRGAVEELMTVAGGAGPVTAVVNAASVGPSSACVEEIVRVDALGTIHVTRAALAVAGPGTAVVNLASTAGHALPTALLPRRLFRQALVDPDDFAARLIRAASLGPERLRPRSAHALSRAFAIWYSARMAEAFGERGARIVSVSPGVVDTARIDEVAEVVAFCASSLPGLLNGTDVLCDGGASAGQDLRSRLTLARA